VKNSKKIFISFQPRFRETLEMNF